MKDLLVISYCLPPLLYPRSFQVQKLLNGLSKNNVSITVVSAKETSSPFMEDEEYSLLLNKEIQKIEVKYKRKSLFRNALGFLTLGLTNTPDDKLGWAIISYVKIKKDLKKYKNLLTISKYDSSHITGLLIKRICPNIKWTAYFSDPWTDNTFNRKNAILEKLNIWLENLVVKKSDHLVFVNEETRKKTMEKYDQIFYEKSHVIPHSFDKTLYPSTHTRNSKYTVRYLGNFYPQRNPKVLFEVLGELKTEGVISSSNFIFEFYGAPFGECQTWIKNNNIQDIAFYKGQVGYLKSLELMKNSDLLLVLDAPADTNVFLTSKIVDYLGSCTPILALTPDKGATAQFIQQTGGYRALPDNRENIKEVFTSILNNKPGKTTPNSIYEKYDSAQISKLYLEFFDRKIKILHAIGTLGTGGKEKQLTEIIKNLPAEQYEQYLFAKNKNSYYCEQVQPYIKRFFTPTKEKFSPGDILKSAHIIDAVKPDIVNSWSTTTSHIFLLAKAFTPFKFTLINASIRSAQIKLSIHNKIEAFLYNFYPIVVSNSIAGLKAFKQLDKKGRYILPNGVNLKIVPERSEIEEKRSLAFHKDKFIITMVGRLDEQKDHKTFIDIAEYCISKESDKYIFYIVGSGPYKERLEKYINSKNLMGIVNILGERKDAQNILRASDLSILVSSDIVGEGISNAILESLAAGTPVLADSNPGNEELLSEDLSFCLVKPKKVEVFYEKILRFRTDVEFKRRISAKGRELIKNKFNLPNTVDKFLQIIDLSLKA